ncbi:MAG: glycosyltransferase family 39 protein [Chloroflexia bacterium]
MPNYEQEQHPKPRVLQMHPIAKQPPAYEAQTATVRWSPRLALVLCALIGVIGGARMVAGFTPPVDAPLGVEATHAAFVRQLVGASPIAPEASKLTLAVPWQGVAPVDPLSGLPVYSWLVAWIASFLGVESSGRMVSLLLSIGAGICLFATVHRTAGARAAVYASLLYGVAPLSVLYGRHFSPATLLLCLQAATLLLLVRWRATSTLARPGGSLVAFTIALATAVVYGLIDPASVFLAIPALVLFLTSPGDNHAFAARLSGRGLRSSQGAISLSPQRGRFFLYAVALVLGAAAWQIYTTGSTGGFIVAQENAFNLGTAISSLYAASTYMQVIGGLVGSISGMLGLLLLGAGLLAGARMHYRYLYHVWLGAAALHVILDGGRLARHDDVLLPLLLPACALVGIGAAWSASFPARIWLAITERNKLPDEEYTVSPHTSWLLDVPEERLTQERPSRPQAQLALGKNLAERSRSAGRKAKRASLLLGGHAAITACFGLLLINNWDTVFSPDKLSTASADILIAGTEISANIAPGSSLIIAGPLAPELFYTSNRTGWALANEDFNLSKIQALQRFGASYLLSADQDLLGRHPEYMGLLANFSVARLTRQYILFDLNTKPAANDRLYFLESGHTLGGEFRRFWEAKGGVQRLGYPVSEEYQDVNPLDGQTRTVQYFERAVLELHPEKAGISDIVMIASAGRWVTRHRDFPRVARFTLTQDRAYFAETGHSLKQAFLRFWLQEGGLTQYGYPISEELPEISAADGKVYTVQYFERARLEWHPIDAGTAKEVQLGLIGKEALEMRK